MITNYIEIEDKLADILRDDARTARVNDIDTAIVVEEPANQLTDTTPFIGIYLDGWESPGENELISDGSRGSLRTTIDLELVLFEFDLENRDACIKRNELLKQVKTVIRENRTIGKMVLMTWFLGGQFENAKIDGAEGFFKGVTLKLRCELRE